MSYLVIAFLFILGTLLGSFLNVVILRYHTGMGLGGRSMCMSCGKKLHAHELIPLFSYLIQRGKCRSCKSSLSIQYPIIEALSGFVVLILALTLSPILGYSMAVFITLFVYALFAFSLLLVISVYDIRHKVIPNALSLAFALISFFSIYISISGPVVPSVLELFSGVFLALPFALLSLGSKERLMGFGDVKLIFGIGYLLGLSSGIMAVLLAFWIGTVVALVLLLFRKFGFNLKTEVPFAPFLSLGTFIVFVTNISVASYIALFV